MSNDKQNRLYYLSRGLCPRCGGKSPVAYGYVLCWECKAKHDANQKERTERYKREGLCHRCGRPLPDGSKYVTCQACRDYATSIRDNSRLREVRAERKAKGLCSYCGKAAAEIGRTYCRMCAIKHKAYQKQYDPDRSKANGRRQARREAGLCIECGRPRSAASVAYCDRCIPMRRDSSIKYQIKKKIKQQAELERAEAMQQGGLG